MPARELQRRWEQPPITRIIGGPQPRYPMCDQECLSSGRGEISPELCRCLTLRSSRRSRWLGYTLSRDSRLSADAPSPISQSISRAFYRLLVLSYFGVG